jgi:hypothetical protein
VDVGLAAWALPGEKISPSKRTLKIIQFIGGSWCFGRKIAVLFLSTLQLKEKFDAGQPDS